MRTIFPHINNPILPEPFIKYGNLSLLIAVPMLITKSSLYAAGSGLLHFPWSICLFLMPLHACNYCNLFKTLISSRTKNFPVPCKF